MKKRNIGYILLFGTVFIACLWAFISAGLITNNFKKRLADESLGKQEVTIQNLLVTETKDGAKSWELFAESGFYDSDNQVAVLNDIVGNFYKDVKEYELIKDGDRIAVCISGGKDSMLMAKLFQEYKRHSNIDFEVKYLVMDPGYAQANREIIEENAKRLKVPITVFETNIFESVYNVDKSPCYLCARMRRGYLYNFAKQLGCNKIALGHHYDDVIETILMGMLHGAQIQSMMPKLHSTNFEGMELIRPLYLIREDDIKAWRDFNGLHLIQCACRFTDTCTSCNNGQNRSKRQETKMLIKELKKTNPDVEKCIFKSVENVQLNTVIAYKKDGVRHSFLDDYDK